MEKKNKEKRKQKNRQKNWRKFWKLGVDEFNTQFFNVSKDGELTATEGHQYLQFKCIWRKNMARLCK